MQKATVAIVTAVKPSRRQRKISIPKQPALLLLKSIQAAVAAASCHHCQTAK